MQPRSFLLSGWRHFSWLFLAHWIFVSFIVLHFFVINGLRTEERRVMELVKPEFSMVTTHTDKRKGNIFFSTPDYFLSLTELVPELDAFLQSAPVEISFTYPVQGKNHEVRRELPLFLVGASYFDAFNGRFIQGRGFERQEVFSGKPYVILSEGALIKLFGDYDRTPSMLTINGVDFQVIGVWAFSADSVIENESIFLPLGASAFFGKNQNTYVNNFILRGKDSRILEKLKKAIDKIQLDAGIQPTRPEFSFVSPTISRKLDYILSHNKAYLDVFIWIIFAVYLYFSVAVNRTWLSFSQDWSVWLFMWKGDTQRHLKEATEAYFSYLSASLLGAILTSLVALGFLKYFSKLPLAFGPEIHFSLILYVAYFPVQLWLMSRWVKKLTFNLT